MAETVVCGGGARDILLAATEGSRDLDGSDLWRAPRAAGLKKLTPRRPPGRSSSRQPLGGPVRTGGTDPSIRGRRATESGSGSRLNLEFSRRRVLV